MDFRPTEEQELLRRTVREFAETEIRPHVREWDQEQKFSADLMPKLASLGLLGIQYPEQYGGAAMSAIDYCICIEELARVDPAIALSVAAHNGLCTSHINMFGSDAQKPYYLRRLIAGGNDEPTTLLYPVTAAIHQLDEHFRRGQSLTIVLLECAEAGLVDIQAGHVGDGDGTPYAFSFVL